MNGFEIFLLVVGGTIAFIILVLVIVKISNAIANNIRIKNEAIVNKHSRIINELQKLNAEFVKYKKVYNHVFRDTDYCNSKREYDRRYAPSNYIRNRCFRNSMNALNAKKQYNYVAGKYDSLYKSIVKNVSTPITDAKLSGISVEKFYEIEKDLKERFYLMPLDREPIKALITVSYTSPAGRNHYSKTYEYSENCFTDSSFKITQIKIEYQLNKSNQKEDSEAVSKNENTSSSKKETGTADTKQVKQELTKKEKEMIVRKTSRVLLKLNELNLEFSKAKRIKYDHVIEGMDSRKSKKEYDDNYYPQKWWVNLYYYDILKNYELKQVYNAYAKKYAILFNDTIRNIQTDEEIIIPTNLSVKEYRQIELGLTGTMYEITLDDKPIILNMKVFYSSPQGYSNYAHFVQYDEAHFKFDRKLPNVNVSYKPIDTEWKELIRAREEKRIKSELVQQFDVAITSILNKKKLIKQIDDQFIEIGGVYYIPFKDNSLVFGCKPDIKGITIADQIVFNNKNLPVVGLIDKAFENSITLKEIVLPSTIEYIGESVFSGCYQLKCIYIPDSVKIIDSNAFNSCFALSKVSVNKNTTIADNAFAMCNMCEIEMR